ncbi:MAG TPA: amino acid ABC transporter substrate-binding protein [Xanthobacteraceae bacterium]|jgi:branched-chain amino acid transport system substrate-binding protein|nr:amino acid ABC transporter substrate-binding protein [Xanthobacteraceae bacterium]
MMPQARQTLRLHVIRWTAVFAFVASATLAVAWNGAAQAADPIKIGFSVSLTGGLASSGKANLLAQQIWQEHVNAQGGLLGRQVEFVYYDDQSKADTVPGIYAKLMDIDKVDLLMGAATNLIVAAMPGIMQHQKMVMVLVALGSNDEFKYPRYFQTAAWGPDTKGVIANAFFEVAKTITPRPKTVAIVGADAEFSNNAMIGARAKAKQDGFEIVYDRTYPPATVDYSPIVHAIAATNPDLVFVASYPLDSVGLIQTASEAGLKTQMFGGAMVGPQYAVFMQKLGNKLDRVVNYHLYVPGPTMVFPGIEEFLKTYQARAPASGTDPLGYYQPPYAYAAMQVIEQAVKGTNSLDDNKLADFIHKNEFDTIVGKLRFDAKGEWATPRLLMMQYQNVDNSGLDQFRVPGKQIILYPPQYKDGDLQAPFGK